MRHLTAAAILTMLSVACSHQEMIAEEFSPPPAPANGMQIRLKEVKNLQPGTSYEYCTWTDQITTTELSVKAMQGFQTKIGHHVVMFYTTKINPPGTTRECTEEDMASFRYVGGAEEEGVEYVAPGDLVYKIPKGVQLVVNHHYLNASQNVMAGESALNIRFAEPSAKNVAVGHLAFLNTELRIPTGRSSMDVVCTMNRDEKLWHIIPHMHRWGSTTRIDFVVGGAVQKVFEQAWQDDFTFHPPAVDWTLEKPMLLKAGDQVKVHCEWDNTTEKPLTFGMEMCVAFASTINSENRDNIACDNGEWVEF